VQSSTVTVLRFFNGIRHRATATEKISDPIANYRRKPLDMVRRNKRTWFSSLIAYLLFET